MVGETTSSAAAKSNQIIAIVAGAITVIAILRWQPASPWHEAVPGIR